MTHKLKACWDLILKLNIFNYLLFKFLVTSVMNSMLFFFFEIIIKKYKIIFFLTNYFLLKVKCEYEYIYQMISFIIYIITIALFHYFVSQ